MRKILEIIIDLYLNHVYDEIKSTLERCTGLYQIL
jgi:hypothetical protein